MIRSLKSRERRGEGRNQSLTEFEFHFWSPMLLFRFLRPLYFNVKIWVVKTYFRKILSHKMTEEDGN
jgi:hypothetical protein